MKISRKQDLSFQKKLMAKCAIKGSNGQVPCSIYKIEEKDKDYFIHLIYKPGWKNYLYATILDGDIRRGLADDMFVLEDKNSNCLAFAEVSTMSREKNSLEFIEVKPVNRAKNDKRKKQYIGETLLNFISQLTKKSGKEVLSVPHADPDAFVFYAKCFFNPTDKTHNFMISGDDMDKLKEQNFVHTGKEIDFTG